MAERMARIESWFSYLYHKDTTYLKVFQGKKKIEKYSVLLRTSHTIYQMRLNVDQWKN